jgi:hypothetical protein
MISKDEYWGDIIQPSCCLKCGNYKNEQGSTSKENPPNIRCWYNVTGDCYKDPRKATPSQLRNRSRLVRNVEFTKECAICLKLMTGRYVKQLYCNHRFHSQCLNKWEKVKKTCPLCRYKYGEQNDIYVKYNNETSIYNYYAENLNYLLQMYAPRPRLNTHYNLNKNIEIQFDRFELKWESILRIITSIKDSGYIVPSNFNEIENQYDTLSTFFYDAYYETESESESETTTDDDDDCPFFDLSDEI